MKFIEAAIKYRPKRSPIFWGLIGLVLIIVTPIMLVMLGTLLKFVVSIPVALLKGESLSLGDKVTWIDMVPVFVVFLLYTAATVCSFTAMLCLIFKKYRLASRLIIAAPVSIILGTILHTQATFLGGPFFAEGLPIIIFVLKEILVAVTLFLYARKYLARDASILVAG